MVTSPEFRSRSKSGVSNWNRSKRSSKKVPAGMVSPSPSWLLRISGDVTITYLTDFDTRAERGVLVYRSGGLSTNEDGSILDPSEGPMTVNYADTGIVVETDRERFIGLVASAGSDLDGTLAGGAIQTNFGTGFIEIRYAAWKVQAGVAQPASVANVVGAGGSSAVVAVTATDAVGATCRVEVVQAGSSGAPVAANAGC